MKNTPENKYYYDARGATVMVTLNDRRRTIQHLDGEGRAARQDQYTYLTYNYQYNLEQSVYYIYSSVLGKLLTEVKSDGTKKRTFVYGTGGVVALQQYSGTTQEVRWEHTDPSNASYIQTAASGAMYLLDSPAELDPLGSSVGFYNPYNQGQNSPQNMSAGGWGYGSWGDPFGGYSCRLDGFEVPCSQAAQALSSGAGTVDFNNSDPWAVRNVGYWTDEDDYGHPDSLGFPGTLTVFHLFPNAFSFSGGIWQQQTQQQELPQEGKSYPNCYTFYDLIYKDSDVQDYFNKIWTDTVSMAAHFNAHKNADKWIGGELGGILFFDESKYQITFKTYKGYEPADAGHNPHLPGNYLEQISQFKSDLKAEGWSARILLAIHTHTPYENETEGYDKDASGGDRDDINRSDYGFDGPFFGIVIYGKGKFKVYGRGKYDDETLKRTCIKNKR